MIRKIPTKLFGTLATVLCAVVSAVHAQRTTVPIPPSPSAPAAAAAAGGGQLEHITVTGYIIPRVGEGPQPVVTYDQDFISKQAVQNANDLLNNTIPGGSSVQNAMTFAGNSNSAGGSSFGLRGLPEGATLVLVDGYRFSMIVRKKQAAPLFRSSRATTFQHLPDSGRLSSFLRSRADYLLSTFHFPLSPLTSWPLLEFGDYRRLEKAPLCPSSRATSFRLLPDSR